MAERRRREPPRTKIDLLTAGSAVFFLMAIALTAVPILRFGATTLSGLMLFLGVAGVAIIGFVGLRQSLPPQDASLVNGDDLLGAILEPAAVAQDDGTIVNSNASWRELMGEDRRLPRTSGLFQALKSAHQDRQAQAEARSRAGETVILDLHPAGPGLMLVRLRAEPPAILEYVAAEPEASSHTLQSLEPVSLDVFATSAPFGAAVLEGTDPLTSRIVEYNAALVEMTADLFDGARLGDLIEATCWTDVEEALAQGRTGQIEVHMAHDTARIAHLYLSGPVGQRTAYLVDITEAKQLERRVAATSKMEAVGKLVAEIAHDFNNLISGINLGLDELRIRHPLGDPSYSGLTGIRQMTDRAANLVHKLKTYSRQDTVRRQTLDLGETVQDFEPILRRVLREDVALHFDYGRDLPLVRADKGQLEMGIMNLAVNAKDAVKSGGGTGIWVKTARLDIETARTLGYGGQLTGQLAMIEVADDGPGIPAAVKDKIFEPFFTTKVSGEGTGLGLATVFSVVKQADGWINVESEENKGARFRIFLPVYVPTEIEEPLESPAVGELSGAPVVTQPRFSEPRISESPAVETQTARPVQPPARKPRDLSGAGRILFVEDEQLIRQVAARLLRNQGYEVIEAGDGEEALLLAQEHAGKIDLMISDVVMPGMDGPTLYKQAKGYLAGAPVLFVSGYAEAEFSRLLEGEAQIGFLPKPLDIKTLAERVKLELQGAAGAEREAA